VNNGGGDGTPDSFEIKVRSNTAKLTNTRIAGLGQCRYLIRECAIFVEYKT